MVIFRKIGVMQCYSALLLGESNLTFVYILPIMTAMALYRDKRYSIISGISIVGINTLYIIYKGMTTELSRYIRNKLH